MKTLTKLALVSAMAISANAMALQSMDDEALSAATGQDGITISLTGNIGSATTKMVIHDSNGYAALTSPVTPAVTALGFTAATAADAGAIVLDGFNIDLGGSGLDLIVDAVGGTDPVLNVNIKLPASVTVNTGTIYVADSGGIAAAAAAQYVDADKEKILDPVSIVLSNASLNVQLGNAPQGAMMKLTGTMTGGITINNLSLYQPTTVTPIAGTTLGQAGIHMASVNVASAGSADFNLTGNINATDTGLQISGLGNADIRVTDLKLGHKTNAAVMGDIALLGLTLPTVTISGH